MKNNKTIAETLADEIMNCEKVKYFALIYYQTEIYKKFCLFYPSTLVKQSL